MLVCLVKTLSCTEKILRSYPPGYVRLQARDIGSSELLFLGIFRIRSEERRKKEGKEKPLQRLEVVTYEDFF
jgi:hypothetical protein